MWVSHPRDVCSFHTVYSSEKARKGPNKFVFSPVCVCVCPLLATTYVQSSRIVRCNLSAGSPCVQAALQIETKNIFINIALRVGPQQSTHAWCCVPTCVCVCAVLGPPRGLSVSVSVCLLPFSVMLTLSRPMCTPTSAKIFSRLKARYGLAICPPATCQLVP